MTSKTVLVAITADHKHLIESKYPPYRVERWQWFALMSFTPGVPVARALLIAKQQVRVFAAAMRTEYKLAPEQFPDVVPDVDIEEMVSALLANVKIVRRSQLGAYGIDTLRGAL